MINPERERVFSKDDSPQQRQINELARLRQLEEEGIHTDSLIKKEGPGPLPSLVLREVKNVHRKLKRRLPKSH